MPDSIVLEPLDVRHVAPLREIHQQPGVIEWWGPMDRFFPFDEPESQRYAIVVDGEIAGLVQHGEEEWPVERHAYVDIFLGDGFTDRGIGTEVLKQVIERLRNEHGHRRVFIDPYAGNKRAIRCYEKVGFRSVGTFSQAADGLDDEHYMELMLE
jgi:aminoglycoside 6'-N-acetyltransferase